MSKVISLEQAAKMIKDGSIIASATSGVSFPTELASAIEKNFLETGHPRNIWHVHAAGAVPGDCWAHEGMISGTISSHESTSPKIAKMIENNQIAGWYMPLGTMLQMFREQGRGLPGTFSKVGLGTFMDPRQDDGCLNRKARAITDKKKAAGQALTIYYPDVMDGEYIFYRGLKYDIGIIRGTTADERGNVTIEDEVFTLEIADVARAVKACGGKVIVEVKRLAAEGSLDPKAVKVPAYLVDYICVEEHPERVVHGLKPYDGSEKITHWDSFTGRLKVPLHEVIEKMPFGPKKVIVRRSVMEAEYGWICNFGIGMPTYCGSEFYEEGVFDRFLMTSEIGAVGGVPASGRDFACHYNVEASVSTTDQFDWFDGVGLDFGVFGLSEAQEDGSINTSRLNGVTLGVGGFANIALGAKKSVFMGTFTTKGLKEHIENGKLVIDQEGKLPKFVKRSDQLTFVAPEALKKGHELIYVTERCVFKGTLEGLVLTEIAPGIDLEKDILAHMGFKPIIPEGGVKLMDPAIFQEKWGGLKAILDEKEKAKKEE
ncbi:MAG: CoA-transferase [Anaerovoracaceae bacterium]|nr:acylcoa--acetate/3-ketoacidcoatransferase [Bacillota bacterium]MDY2671341.1 CoA-transferase [Anaerovoracaceae bacterium]